MKKICIISLSIISFLILIYFMIFILFFTSPKLTRQIKNFTETLTKREVLLSKSSFSPFGSFNMQNFKLSDSSGFKSAVFLSISRLSAKVSMPKLLKAYLVINSIYLDGLVMNLNYEKNRKFDSIELMSEIKKNFASNFAKRGFIRKIEVHSIVIDNSTVNLKLDKSNIVFRKIVLQSSVFDYHKNNFKGSGSFEFKVGSNPYGVSFEFNYDRRESTLYITDFICKDLLLYAEGKIEFLETGKINLEYTGKIKKAKLKDLLLDLSGLPAFVGKFSDNMSDDMEDMIISSPAKTEKQLKTVI